MNIIRSLFFNLAFLSWSAFCFILFLPSLLLPRPYVVQSARIWSKGNLWLCKTILNLRLNLVGHETLPKTPVIIASKHQSAWETVVFFAFLPAPTIILKKELLWVPLFGQYIQRMGMIRVARSKGKSTEGLRNFLTDAARAVKAGHQILIFPEGTRSQPGHAGTYHSGVGSLYANLKIPVIPVAHNAGVFWPRREFLKKSGVLTLAFLEPIQPGLSRQEFMRRLEETIETHSNALLPTQQEPSSLKGSPTRVFGL